MRKRTTGSFVRKLRRFLILLIAVLLTGGIAVFALKNDGDARGRVTLWCVRGAPMSEETEKLAEEFNSQFTRKTLPVSVRIFENETELSAAFETGSPDILLCSHYTAFSLFSAEKLTDIGDKLSAPPAYSKNVRSRSNSIGRSFFPVGFSIPVLIVNRTLLPQFSFDNIEDFFGDASVYTAANGKPYFACDSFAEFFMTCMIRSGAEFEADYDAIEKDTTLLALYNLVAETAFEGSMVLLDEPAEYVLGGALPCAFVSSAKLRGIPRDGLSVVDIPAPVSALAPDFFGEAYGFAITNGGCRSTADTAAFISWIFSSGRCAGMAEENCLAPAEVVTNWSGRDLFAGIVGEKIVSLRNADSEYSVNQKDFDERVTAAFKRLLP